MRFFARGGRAQPVGEFMKSTNRITAAVAAVMASMAPLSFVSSASFAQSPVAVGSPVIVTTTRFPETTAPLSPGVTVITAEEIRNSTATTGGTYPHATRSTHSQPVEGVAHKCG